MGLSLSRLSLVVTSATTLSVTASPAYAEFKNRPFSVFGAFGLEYVSYQEHLDNFGGREVNSDFSSVNLVQRSGGYTAATENLGFFINTGSTLISNEADEEWEAKNIQGNAQEDVATMNYQTLDIMLAYHLRTGTYLLGGMHYQKIAFSRFDWRSASGTEAFADSIEDHIRSTPELFDPIFFGVNERRFKDRAGNVITTVEEYFEATRFKPEETQDVVFEDAVSFGVMFGVGFDSYFIRPARGMRYLWEFGLGSQLYENVLNSSESRALTRTFGGGIDATGKAAVGYQFSHQLGIMLGLDAHYSFRKDIRDKVNATKTVILPENEFYSVASYASISWNFR